MVLSKYFCLRGPKNFVRGPFCVSEYFWYWKKILGKRYGGYHDFASKTFCLTVPKTFVGEPFNVSESFGYPKILCIRRGYHHSPLKNFCHSADEILRGTLLCASKIILVSKIFVHRRGGGITIFSKKVLSHRTEMKHLVREPSFRTLLS